MSFNVPRQNGHMRKIQIARALPSAASDPRCNTNCGSSVDGTMAVNMAFHQFFRHVAFLTRLESRRAPSCRNIDPHWRCRPVPTAEATACAGRVDHDGFDSDTTPRIERSKDFAVLTKKLDARKGGQDLRAALRP